MALLKPNKSREFYTARLRKPGADKPTQRCLGTKNKKQARYLHDQWKQEILQAKVVKKFNLQGALFFSECEAWDLQRAKNEAKSSAKTIKDGVGIQWKHLRQFFERQGIIEVDNITPEDCEAYKTHRLTQASYRSPKIELQSLRRAIRHFIKVGRIDQPFALEKWPTFIRPRQHVKDPQRKGLRVDRKILNLWLADLKGEARRRAEFLVTSGLRGEECDRILVTDFEIVNASNGVGRLYVRGKTGPRTITLTATAYAMLIAQLQYGPFTHKQLGHLAENGERGPAIISHDHIWSPARYKHQYNNRAEELGVTRGIHERDLRHTFCSEMAVAGVERGALQKYTGHSTADIAEIYQHRSEHELAEVADIFNNAPRLSGPVQRVLQVPKELRPVTAEVAIENASGDQTGDALDFKAARPKSESGLNWLRLAVITGRGDRI